MDNKEMTVYKERFISKIRKFFKNLFTKKELQLSDIQVEQENISEEKNEFLSYIKVDTKEINKVSRRTEFLEKVDNNAEELNKLSIEELVKLEKYYDKIIEKNNGIIKNLQSKY